MWLQTIVDLVVVSIAVPKVRGRLQAYGGGRGIHVPFDHAYVDDSTGSGERVRGSLTNGMEGR